MSSLAELPALVGFFSYSREDDEGSGGKLSKLRERIQEELRLQLGRTRKDFRLWQDKVAIAHGELWEDTIKKGISESVFFIPIITPTAVRSSHCKFEFESFLAREKELDRNNLIFPILYVPVPALTDERWRQDPLLSIVGSRQYEDWQNLRHLDASSSEVVALRVEKFCANICRALEQEWLSPEERREAEARRAAEAERRRQQEAEIKQRADEEERRRKAEAEERQRAEEERHRQEAENKRRLDEAEARKRRRQDEERRRLEKEAKLAKNEAQPRTQLEQEPQQQVKPWVVPKAAWVSLIVAAVLIFGVWAIWLATVKQSVAPTSGSASVQQSVPSNTTTAAQQPVPTSTTTAAQEPVTTGLFTMMRATEAKGDAAGAAAYVRSIAECEQNCARSATCKVYSYGGTYGSKSCCLYTRAQFSPNAAFDTGVRK